MRGARFRCAYGQILSQAGMNSLRSRRKPRPDVPMSTTPDAAFLPPLSHSTHPTDHTDRANLTAQRSRRQC